MGSKRKTPFVKFFMDIFRLFSCPGFITESKVADING